MASIYSSDNIAPSLTSDSFIDTSAPKGYGQLMYPEDLFSSKQNYSNSFTAYFISFKDDPKLMGNESSTSSGNIFGKYERKGSDSVQSLSSLKKRNKDFDYQKLTNTIVGAGAGAFIGTAIGSIDANKLIDSVVKNPVQATGIKAAVGVGKIGTELVGGAAGGYLAAKANQEAGWLTITHDRRTQKACICLPTPMIVANYEVNWSEESNKLLGGLLAGGADFLNNIDDKNLTGSGIDSLMNSLGSGFTAGALSTPMFGTALGVMSREAANPRKEQLFKDVGLREFNISYVFAPTSEQEAKNVESIIQQFKYHAHPSFRGTDNLDGTNSNLLNYPSEFDIIHYFNNKRNTHLPKHTTSVLKRVSVDYSNGNDNYTFFGNGMPSMIKMDLTFAEIAMLTKEDIAKGY